MIELKLEQFEGPMDLLLHLIRTNKIDIYDIPIFTLTEQYISYLKAMENLNMEIASEFVVMASELLYIKSKMLLPKPSQEEEEAEDPRKDLMQKLLEYQQYKELSGYLKEREPLGAYTFTKTAEKIKGLIRYTKLDIPKDSLISALEELVMRIETKLPPDKGAFSDIVEREVVSVSLMSDKLTVLLKQEKKLPLVDAFLKICATRAQVAAAFVALLDLIRENKVSVICRDNLFILSQ